MLLQEGKIKVNQQWEKIKMNILYTSNLTVLKCGPAQPFEIEVTGVFLLVWKHIYFVYESVFVLVVIWS